MIAKRIASALLITVLCAGTAHAIEVHKTGSVKGTPAEVWRMIGDFCAIGDWHPAVDTCETSEEAGVTYRTLNLNGGGVIKEKLIEQSDTGYTYEIVESPLPVENYRSTIGVKAEGDGTMIDWSGSFDAKGASDADAEGVIAGIYTAGIDAIAAMAGN